MSTVKPTVAAHGIIQRPTGFSLQREDYGLRVSPDKTTGTQKYLRDGGIETLPALGDAFDPEHLNCVAVEYGMSIDPRHKDLQMWSVYYDDMPNLEIVLDESQSIDDLPSSLASGFEKLSLPSFDTKMRVEVTNPIFTRTITKIYHSYAKVQTVISDYVGSVNDTAFLGWGAGDILFVGGPVTEFRNQAGEKRWKADWQFRVYAKQSINVNALSIAYSGSDPETITVANGVMTLDAGTGEDATFTLLNYSMAELATAISAVTSWSALVLGNSAGMRSILLDPLIASSAPRTLTATMYAPGWNRMWDGNYMSYGSSDSVIYAATEFREVFQNA